MRGEFHSGARNPAGKLQPNIRTRPSRPRLAQWMHAFESSEVACSSSSSFSATFASPVSKTTLGLLVGKIFTWTSTTIQDSKNNRFPVRFLRIIGDGRSRRRHRQNGQTQR